MPSPLPSVLGPADSGRLFADAGITRSVVLDPSSRIDIPDCSNPPAGIPPEVAARAPRLPSLCAFPIPGDVPLPATTPFGWKEPRDPETAPAPTGFPMVSILPPEGVRRFLYPAAFPDFPLQSWNAGFLDCPKAADADGQVDWPAPAPFDARTLSREPDLIVHGFYRYEWADLLSRAKAIETPDGGTRLALDPAPSYGFCDINRCRVVNVFQALHAGRYYLDRANRLLFLAEPPDGTLSFAGDAAPPRISLDGAHDVVFRRCVFHDIRGTALRARRCRNLVFEDCVFECIGGWALDIKNCTGFRMERCRLRDTAGGALSLHAGDRRTLEGGGALVRH
jgi:hypothetical protein